MASGEEETMRSQGFGLGNWGVSFYVVGKMEEGAANGKTVNSIFDILGLRKM